GSPHCRQWPNSSAAVVFAVTVTIGQAPTRPPCSDTAVSTWTSRPPSRARPSTKSRLSNSARRAPTRGEEPPPAGGGGGAAAALQDAVDGAHGGRVGNAAGQQFAVNGRGTKVAQGAGLAQLPAQIDHEILQGGRGAAGRLTRAARPVGPIDAVEALATGAAD